MEIYQTIKDHFDQDNRVMVNHGKGAQGIKLPIKGKAKMFVMFYKGDLLLQSTVEHINSLIEQGLGEPYDPGTGKVMIDRTIVSHTQSKQWISIIEDAITTLSSGD